VTTAARQAEADKASVAFQLALTQIGAGTVQDAMKLWAEVPTTGRGPVVSAWLKKAITLVMTRRRMSRDLARAYYRLARALQTGTTIADPYHPEPTYITLDVLRREFAALVGDQPEPPQEDDSKDSTTDGPVDSQQAASQPPKDTLDQPSDHGDDSNDDGFDRVLVEELDDLREEEERIEREAEQELATVLEALGPANLDYKLGGIDPGQPAKDADRLRQEAHDQAGARQAAAAERVAMNGARSTVWNHASKDRRAIGYVRLSRSGTPCGWCAMLISRGAVYRSEKSAIYADGDKYHDNCHCYAMPIFSHQQFDSSPLFELNRRYSQDWPRATRGLSGKAAVSAWRRYVRDQQKAAALETRRSTTNVLEA